MTPSISLPPRSQAGSVAASLSTVSRAPTVEPQQYTAEAPHPEHDRQLLTTLQDGYREFQNALNHNKQPSSHRKMLKDYRCHHAMAAALNARDPSLNLRYCSGLSELDALLRQVASTPGESVHRAVANVTPVARLGFKGVEGQAHHLALEIRKDAQGNITILGLDSLREDRADPAYYAKLRRTLEKHRNVRCMIVPLNIQHSRMECAIHSMYMLQQLHKHGVALPPFTEEESTQKLVFKNRQDFRFHVDVYGLLDSFTAYEDLVRHQPELGEAPLSDTGQPLLERLRSNRICIPQGNDTLTYSNSAELYRLDLYRMAIDWVAAKPQREVNFEMNRVRPVRAGSDWLKKLPLSAAKTPTAPAERHGLNVKHFDQQRTRNNWEEWALELPPLTVTQSNGSAIPE